jgi:hypothetical protein
LEKGKKEKGKKVGVSYSRSSRFRYKRQNVKRYMYETKIYEEVSSTVEFIVFDIWIDVLELESIVLFKLLFVFLSYNLFTSLSLSTLSVF